MKAVVINYSGNVGKTTVSRHLLSPRMNKAQVFTVESINSDGTEDQIVRGKHFAEMLETLANLDDAVIDVGASNVEDCVGLMGKYRGSHEDFDYFIVPTVAKDKQQSDTISVIEALAELGVPAKKMRVVFNMVEYDEKGCVAKFFEIRDNARFLAIEKPND
jgi:dethiobiotin synthetase